MQKKLLLSFNFLVIAILNLSGCIKYSERGEQCLNITTVQIFQAVKNGGLARQCDFDGCGNSKQHYFVATDNRFEEYYDGLKITKMKGTCFVRDGIYKYKSADKIIRTVPKIKLVDRE